MKLNKYILYTLIEYREKREINTLLSAIKHFSRWRKSFNFEDLTDVPWLNFDVTDFLKKWLRKDMTVFEYGSGSSTIFFANRTKLVVSIEHDEHWFNKMNKHFLKNQFNNINYKLILPEINNSQDEDMDYKNPFDYFSSDSNYAFNNFEAYAKSICDYPDESFDLIVIDGRSRPSCIFHAIPKLKKGGYLLVDNTERDYYLNNPFLINLLTDMIRVDYRAHVPGLYHYCSTTLLRKK